MLVIATLQNHQHSLPAFLRRTPDGGCMALCRKNFFTEDRHKKNYKPLKRLPTRVSHSPWFKPWAMRNKIYDNGFSHLFILPLIFLRSMVFFKIKKQHEYRNEVPLSVFFNSHFVVEHHQQKC
jgi:hypothetical protein